MKTKLFFFASIVLALFAFVGCSEDEKTPTLGNTTWIDATDPSLNYKLVFQDEGLTCSLSAYNPIDSNVPGKNCTVKVSGNKIELYAFGSDKIFYSGTFTATTMTLTHWEGTPILNFVKQ
jgi:uncharacterized protein YcfL